MLRALLFFLLSFPTYAAIQTINVRFDDGGSATGFIDLPVPLWNTPSNWNIHVQGGDQPPFDYTPANSFADVFFLTDDWQSVFVQANNDSRALVFTEPKNDDGLLVTRQRIGGPSRGEPMSYEVGAAHAERVMVSGCLSDGRACPPVRCVESGKPRDCGFAQLPQIPRVAVPEPHTYLIAVLGLLCCAGWRGVLAQLRHSS